MPRVIDKYPTQRGAGGGSVNSPTRGGLQYQDPMSQIDGTAQGVGDGISRGISAQHEKAVNDIAGAFTEIGEDIAETIANLIAFAATIGERFHATWTAIVRGLLDPNATEQEVAQAEAALIALNGRVTALEGGGTVTTYTVSGIWTNPYPTEHKRVKVAVYNGGDGGARCTVGYRDQPKGGQPGGFIERWFWTDELPATVAMTIGGAGAGNTSGGSGLPGGITSFGTLVVGTKGVGAVYNDGARMPVPGAAPGRGGDGVFTPGTGDSDVLIPSTDGGGGPFAAGGLAGFGSTTPAVHGKNGASAPLDVPSGGGGGGGGSAASGAVGNGGNGGFPGGGGGAAGTLGLFNGNGGTAGQGCIYIIMED